MRTYVVEWLCRKARVVVVSLSESLEHYWECDHISIRRQAASVADVVEDRQFEVEAVASAVILLVVGIYLGDSCGFLGVRRRSAGCTTVVEYRAARGMPFEVNWRASCSFECFFEHVVYLVDRWIGRLDSLLLLYARGFDDGIWLGCLSTRVVRRRLCVRVGGEGLSRLRG